MSISLPLKEAVDAKIKMKAATNDIIRRARFHYVAALEVMIQRYQRDMWLTVQSYESRLRADATNSTHNHPTTVNLVADLNKIGEAYLEKATNIGYERALEDLYRFGWIKGFAAPIVAPRDVANSAIKENRDYLEKSLLPDLVTKLSNAKNGDEIPAVLGSFRGRVHMYGHWVWRTAERAYTLGLREFNAFHNRTAVHMREGGAGSGNFDHAGRPGEVGGSSSTSVGSHFINLPPRGSDAKPNDDVLSMSDKDVADMLAMAHKDVTVFSPPPIPFSASNFSEDFGKLPEECEQLVKNYVDSSESDETVAARVAMNTLLKQNATANLNPHDVKAFNLFPDEYKDYINEDHALLKEAMPVTAAAFDKLFPNGIDLYRGVHADATVANIHALKQGDTLRIGPLTSTTDSSSVIAEYSSSMATMDKSETFMTFKAVRGNDVLASHLIPGQEPLFSEFSTEKETLLNGSQDWTLDHVDHVLLPRGSQKADNYVFTHKSLKESEAKSKVLVFADDGSSWWKDEEDVIIPTPGRFQFMREGGEGSGNFNHSGRPGEVGGSSSSGPSGVAVAKDGSGAGHVQTAANEIGVDPNGPAPWDLKADAPPRYPGDTSIYSPAEKDANGHYALGRRLQGTALDPDDPKQVAMYTFISGDASKDELKSFEQEIQSKSDHAQLHPGEIARNIDGQLVKTQGNNYWIRGNMDDLKSLSDSLGPKLQARFGSDHAFMTMMTDKAPDGTPVNKGTPMEHMRVVVPFAADTPKDSVGTPSLSPEVRDNILKTMSGPEGRMVWQHADFNGMHLATTTTPDVVTKLFPEVAKLGATNDVEDDHGPSTSHNAGATRFIPTKINLERYNVTGLRGG